MVTEAAKLAIRHEAESRARTYGCEPGELQRRWRQSPPLYATGGTWHRECTAAVLDALNQNGIDAWDGDAVSCVVQIVEAYAKKMST